MKDTRTLTDDIAAIQALVLFMYNTNKDTIFSVAYGETETFRHQEAYRDEKIDMINRGGLEMLWGYLDSAGRKRLVEAALDKYAAEVGRTNEDVTDAWTRG